MNAIPTTNPITFDISGMSCGHCVKAVTAALAGVPGAAVQSVSIGSAQVSLPDEATVTAAIAALDDAGYPATVRAPSAIGSTPTAARSCCGGQGGLAGSAKSCC